MISQILPGDVQIAEEPQVTRFGFSSDFGRVFMMDLDRPSLKKSGGKDTYKSKDGIEYKLKKNKGGKGRSWTVVATGVVPDKPAETSEDVRPWMQERIMEDYWKQFPTGDVDEGDEPIEAELLEPLEAEVLPGEVEPEFDDEPVKKRKAKKAVKPTGEKKQTKREREKEAMARRVPWKPDPQYGPDKPGSWGDIANHYSAHYGMLAIEAGETDVEKISYAIHNGWKQAVRDQKRKMSPEQWQRRKGLFKRSFKAWQTLPEDEKDKDRVRAKSLLRSHRAKTSKSSKSKPAKPPRLTREQRRTLESGTVGSHPAYSQLPKSNAKLLEQTTIDPKSTVQLLSDVTDDLDVALRYHALAVRSLQANPADQRAQHIEKQWKSQKTRSINAAKRIYRSLLPLGTPKLKALYRNYKKRTGNDLLREFDKVWDKVKAEYPKMASMGRDDEGSANYREGFDYYDEMRRAKTKPAHYASKQNPYISYHPVYGEGIDEHEGVLGKSLDEAKTSPSILKRAAGHVGSALMYPANKVVQGLTDNPRARLGKTNRTRSFIRFSIDPQLGNMLFGPISF